MTGMNIRDFIASRETELKQQQATIRAEMAEIKALKATLDATSDGEPAPRRKSSSPTIKDLIEQVLEDWQDGATAEEIIKDVADKFSKNVPRSSMSPQLTRLKNDDRITRWNDRWILPKYVPDNSSIEGVSSPSMEQSEDALSSENKRNMADGDRHSTGEVGLPPSPAMSAPNNVSDHMRDSREGQAFDLME